MSGLLVVRSAVVAAIFLVLLVFLPPALFGQTVITAGAGPVIVPPPPALPDMVARDGDGRVTMRATRIARPLTIDGRLDESFYNSVPPVNGFIQQEPSPGQPATEDTDVWVFYDNDNLYIAGRMWDSHPERIQANELRRDNRNIGQNDSLSVAIDTFYDRRSGYYFQTNALGGIREAIIADERTGNNFDWNTVWNTKAARFEQGWASEIVIPFRSLRFRQSSNQVWSFNVRRVVRWKNETSYLTEVPASYGGSGATRFNVAATLVGIEVPRRAGKLEAKPYLIGGVTTNNTVAPSVRNDPNGDFGVDMKYGLTRSLTMDFTYNTDFAQVEDDEAQVNLTRFSQFFPERRDFFLEGQGLFEFASVRTRGGGGGGGGDGGGSAAPNETPLLFFSRRIGLQNGRATPILAGARLTGRVGQRLSVGLLNIQSADDTASNAVATNFSVVRLRRDILRRSNVGIIATNRSPTSLGTDSNQVAGVDANFGFYENINLSAYYAGTRSPGRTADDRSYRAQFDWSPDRYGVNYEMLKVGEDFNPDIGFLRRQNFRRQFGQLRFSPRPRRIRSIRKLWFESNIDYITNNTDSRIQSRLLQGTVRVDLLNGDTIEANANGNYEALTAPFEISRGVILPVGGYPFNDFNASYRFGPQRKFTGDVQVVRGQFYNGTRTEMRYSGRLEVSPRLSVEPRASISSVHLDQGDFVTRLLTARTTFTVTPRMFASALVQYNSSTNAFTTNVRVRWEYRPGSDLFVVYTEGRNTAPNVPTLLQSRGLIVKYTQLFRF